MNARWRYALAGLALGTIALSSGCAKFSKGPPGNSAVVAYKVERLTFVSTAGQRCEVDAVTYSIVKPGETFHCKWGNATKPAEKSVTLEEPQSLDAVDQKTSEPKKSLDAKDPSKQSQSPWWWPFKGSGSSSKKKK